MEVTDTIALEGLMHFVGMFGMGIPGVGLALGGISLIMTLLKWKRLGGVFEKIPRQWRFLLPLSLGGAAGGISALVPEGNGMVMEGIIQGLLVAGGGQQMIYQALKGTWAGKIISMTVGTDKAISYVTDGLLDVVKGLKDGSFVALTPPPVRKKPKAKVKAKVKVGDKKGGKKK